MEQKMAQKKTLTKRVTVSGENEGYLAIIRRHHPELKNDRDVVGFCIQYYFEKNKKDLGVTPIFIDERIQEMDQRVTFLEEQYENFMIEKSHSFTPESK